MVIDSMIQEHAYLVARGVRALALLDDVEADGLEMLRIATQLESVRVDGAIPFVIDLRDGRASAGFASARWVVELYEWARTEALPERHRHRVIGLLLGYSADAIANFEEDEPIRRFQLTVSRRNDESPENRTSAAAARRSPLALAEGDL